jgi:hypothetical protein
VNIKALLWRVIYAAILVVILVVIVPLVFAMVGIGFPAGPAVTLIKFAFACLVVIYVFFGPEPPSPF